MAVTPSDRRKSRKSCKWNWVAREREREETERFVIRKQVFALISSDVATLFAAAALLMDRWACPLGPPRILPLKVTLTDPLMTTPNLLA